MLRPDLQSDRQITDTSVDASPGTLTATSDSGLTVTFTSLTTSICTVTRNQTTLLTVGLCKNKADQAGNAAYNPANPVEQDFNVKIGKNKITFPYPGKQAYSTVLWSSLQLPLRACRSLTHFLPLRSAS